MKNKSHDMNVRRPTPFLKKVSTATAAVMLHTSLPAGIMLTSHPVSAESPVATPAVAQAGNEVREVRVERNGDNRVIHIATDREPAFTVFRLNDPMRLVIDIARGSVAHIDAPIDVNDGVVTEIAKAQFADGKNLLGRLVIGFEHTVDYEVKGTPSGIRLMVRDTQTVPPVARKEDFIKGANKTVEAASVSANATAATNAIAATTGSGGAQKAEVAGKADAHKSLVEGQTTRANAATEARTEPQIVAATGKERNVNDQPSPIPVDKTLTKVKTHARGDSAEVALLIQGGAPAFELLELEDPPRVVVDLLGTKMKSLRPNQFELGKLGRIRLGAHADKVRLVFDAPSGIPEYEVLETPRGLKIVASSKKPAPAPAMVATKIDVAPVVPTRVETKVAAEPVAAPAATVTASATATPGPAPAVSPTPTPTGTLPTATVAAPAAEETEAVLPVVARAPQQLTVKEAQRVSATVPAEAKPEAVAASPIVREEIKPIAREEAKPAAREEGKAVVTAAPAAPEKVAPVRTVVDALDFDKVGSWGRVVINVPPQATYEIDDRLPRAPVLRLTGVSLAKKLERSHDVSRERTQVLRVTSFNERGKQKAVSIIANLKTPGVSHVSRHGDQLVWELSPQTPQVLPLAQAPVENVRKAPEVAGFAAEALQVAKTAVPQAEGARITIDTRGADLVNFLRLISEVSGQNIIAGDDVSGKVNLRLRSVPWEQALDVALQTRGYGRTRQGGIIRVAPLEKLQKEREAELARLKTEEQVAPTYVRLIPVNYAKAKEVLAQVTPLLTKDRGKAQVDERTNTIVAEDLMAVLNKVETLVKRLDTQTPQVLIESRIVEANTSFVREIGIQWGGTGVASAATGNPTGLSFPSTIGVAGGADGQNPLSANNAGTFLPPNFAVNLPAAAGPGAGGALGLIFGNASNTAQLALRLSALENNGQVRIVSAPKIATLDNAKARIAQGVSIPISVVSAAGTNTRFVEANLELEVTPHVTQDGSVMMEIKASKNEANFARTGAAGDPTIEKKTAETQVLVKDGETTVIGGIYTRNSSELYTELPWLGKIPVLGWLFKRKRSEDSRAELLVFITPRIVNRQQMQMSSNTGGGL